LDWSHMGEAPARDVGTEQCFHSMGGGHKLIASQWGKPAAMLMCAGGFSFHGRRAWMNDRVFWVDTEAVCRKLGELYRDERFVSTLPGQTFWMQDNRITSIDSAAPFLATAPLPEWPSRGRRVDTHIEDYAPATDRHHLGEGDVERLHEALDELAQGLIGGILF